MAVWTVEGGKLVKPSCCPVCGDGLLSESGGWCHVSTIEAASGFGPWPVYSFCMKLTTCWCVTCGEGWCDNHDPRS